ncbi:uncharacterized protein F5891DRAFT_1077676, partial [Suillus fuscotomentosus]
MNEPTHYISIHIWHGDFSQQCEEFPVDQCFALLSVIARRVSEVQKELRIRKGIEATHCGQMLGRLGRTWVDYAAEGTEEIYGKS